jgi:hypothetical protein
LQSEETDFPFSISHFSLPEFVAVETMINGVTAAAPRLESGLVRLRVEGAQMPYLNERAGKLFR